MEPPTITFSKRRDPLHDGGVFHWEQGSPGRSLAQPAPSAGVGTALVAANPLLRSAAEAAAAINRSAEAQHIKRSWEALVGASPLPAAVRTVFSPALSQPRLTGDAGACGFHSPVASSPFLHGHYPRPPLPVPGTRLQYALPPVPHAEALPAPSALYRSAVQQQAQLRQQQEQAAQAAAAAAAAGPSAGPGVEGATSKFTRVVHSHSPGYQAMVSSTLQMVRQSSEHPLPPPSVPSRAGMGVTLKELPPAEPPAQQQQQQQGVLPPYCPRPAMSHQEPVVLVQVPLLPAQRAALAIPPTQPPLEGAPPPALAQGASPPAPAVDARLRQWSQAAEVQEQEQERGAGDSDRAAAEGPGTGATPLGGSRTAQLESEGAGRRDSLEERYSTVERAMAAVGDFARWLATPIPQSAEGPIDELAGGLKPDKQHESRGGHVHGDEEHHGEQQQQHEDKVGEDDEQQQKGDQQQQQSGAETEVPAGHEDMPASAEAADEAEDRAGTNGEGGGAPLNTPVEASGPRRGEPESTKAGKRRQGRSAGRAAAGQQQEGQSAGAKAGEAVTGDVAGPSDSWPAPDASAEPAAKPHPSSGKGKSTSSRAAKKRPRLSAGGEGASKRWSMHLRGDVPTVQPILHSIGEGPAGIEVKRSGRTRMPPLPFWTNSKLVMNAQKDVTGVERKDDLLGLSGQQQKLKPGAAGGAKAEPSKAKPAPPGKPTQHKPQQAEKASKGGPGRKGKQLGGAAAAEQPAAKQAAAPKARPAAKAPARQRRQGSAGKGREGPKEIAAALQLQQLGRGAAPASDASEAAAAGPSKAKQQQKRVTAAAACPPVPQEPQGLAALAASAGARAAKDAATARAAAPAGQKTRKAAASSTAAAAGAATPPPEGGAARGGGPSLPVVEGVPPAVMQQLSRLGPQQRSRCGRCKNCLRQASKQACLARRALREWHDEGGEGGGEAAATQQQERQNKAAGEPQAPGRRKEPAGKAPTHKAAGVKRAGEAVGREGPPTKRARAQRMPQQQAQQQQAQQQQQAGEVEEGQVEEKEAPAPTQGGKGGVGAGAGEPAEQAQEAGEQEEEEQGWTASQVAALQKAWLQINPTATNFWQLVSKQVPGKTAAECYNRHMSRHPTPPHPVRKAGSKKYMAAAKEGARRPELKPGASKQAVQNAARKYSRQLQWQQKASRAQAASGSRELVPELLEEMEAAERKDRYIDQILRKRMGRPLGAGPRGRKAAAPLLPLQPGVPAAAGGGAVGQDAGVRKLKAQDSERAVCAALATLPKHDLEEDRDSEEGSDYYWSDA